MYAWTRSRCTKQHNDECLSLFRVEEEEFWFEGLNTHASINGIVFVHVGLLRHETRTRNVFTGIFSDRQTINTHTHTQESRDDPPGWRRVQKKKEIKKKLEKLSINCTISTRDGDANAKTLQDSKKKEKSNEFFVFSLLR